MTAFANSAKKFCKNPREKIKIAFSASGDGNPRTAEKKIVVCADKNPSNRLTQFYASVILFKVDNASYSSSLARVKRKQAMDNEQKVTKRNSKVQNLKQFAVMNLGVFLLSFGVYMFEVPSSFAIGGVGGVSVVIAKAVHPHVSWLTQPVIMAAINILLLIVGFIFLGKSVSTKTLYCTLAYTFEVWLFGQIHDMTDKPLTGGNAAMLELFFSIAFTGGGSALIFNCGASSGGSDIIALLLKKYTRLNIAVAVFCTDIFVACLPFSYSVEIALYSILGVCLKTFIIDGVIERITKTKYVTIITTNADVVSGVILKYINRGFTSYQGVGGYTGEPRTIIITVCGKAQALRLKLKLHEIDPSSFVIITDANEILGKGFSERL